MTLTIWAIILLAVGVAGVLVYKGPYDPRAVLPQYEIVDGVYKGPLKKPKNQKQEKRKA